MRRPGAQQRERGRHWEVDMVGEIFDGHPNPSTLWIMSTPSYSSRFANQLLEMLIGPI